MSFRALSEFFWPPVENDDHLVAARKRLLICMAMGVFVGGILLSGLAWRDMIKRPDTISTILFLLPLMFLIPPLLVRRKGVNLNNVAHVFLGLFFFAGFLAAYSGGGFHSLGTFYLTALPPMAMMLLGARPGLCYLVAVLASYALFYFGQGWLMSYPNTVDPAQFRYWNFVGLTVILVGMSGAVAVYHNGMARATRSLLSSRMAADSGSRAKSEFLANMSHEIRTPLNGVLGMAQALETRDLGTEERTMVSTIRDSGNTLLAILNDVLDLSKIESGRTLLSPADDDLHLIVGRIYKLFLPLAREKGLKLNLKIASDVPSWVHVDAIRIRQCVSNLVSNAVKFTEQGGVSIKVMAKPLPSKGGVPAGHFITVTVTDTGIGIEQDKVDNLFTAFQQADASISRRYGGTGLGLAVARNLARQMGGDIDVKSTPRVGSRFVFTFMAAPARRANPGQDKDRSADLREARLDGISVMVVDDQPINRQVVRIFLEHAGARVIEAENGREALQRLAEDPPDIMLLDVHMPVMDGIETIKRLRTSGGLYGKALPVIALTADAMTGAAERLVNMGMDAHLPKPVVQADLIRRIRAVLATRRALRRDQAVMPEKEKQSA